MLLLFGTWSQVMKTPCKLCRPGTVTISSMRSRCLLDVGVHSQQRVCGFFSETIHRKEIFGVETLGFMGFTGDVWDEN